MEQAKEDNKGAAKTEADLAAICSFSGRLAHDLNNYLTPILACGQMLKDGLDPTHPLYFCAEQIAQAGDTCFDLAKRLQAIGTSRKSNHVIDLRDVLTSSTEMIRPPEASGIRIEFDLPDDSLMLEGDSHQLQILVQELGRNAVEAMPQGGTVTLSARYHEGDAPVSGSDAPAWIKLTVTDEGVGMSPEVLSRLYEPYFTTHKGARGRGFGLAMAYGIVRRHEGTIACDSSPGAGAVFTIFLPADPTLEKTNAAGLLID